MYCRYFFLSFFFFLLFLVWFCFSARFSLPVYLIQGQYYPRTYSLVRQVLGYSVEVVNSTAEKLRQNPSGS